MKPFCFIHGADLHLDTPFAGVGKIDSRLQQKLRDASLAAFDNLVAAALQRNVDFVVLAGDIYDGPERGTRAQFRFLQGLRELDRKDIHCFFVHGNHDPVGEGWSALAREDFPARAVLVDACEQVASHPVDRNGEVVAVVHGISFRTRHENRNLSRLFPAATPQGPFHVGLLHCNVGGLTGHGNYAPCSAAELCSRGIDYWALGHIHKRADLRPTAPCIHYPGNLQARGFDECGAKGATLVHVLARDKIELEFLPLDEVRFSQLAVNAGPCSSLDQVLGVCEQEVALALERNAGRFVLARLEITGQSAAHATLLRAVSSEDNGLVSALRDRLPAQRVWLDSVVVRTLPIVERHELAGAAGFESSLIRQSDEWLSSDEKRVEFLTRVQQPLQTGLRFQEFVNRPEADDARRLLERAEGRLLSLLKDEPA